MHQARLVVLGVGLGELHELGRQGHALLPQSPRHVSTPSRSRGVAGREVRGGCAGRCVLFHVYVSCSALSVHLVTAGRIAVLATALLGRPLRSRRAGRACARVSCRRSSAGSSHCLQTCGRRRMLRLKFCITFANALNLWECTLQRRTRWNNFEQFGMGWNHEHCCIVARPGRIGTFCRKQSCLQSPSDVDTLLQGVGLVRAVRDRGEHWQARHRALRVLRFASPWACLWSWSRAGPRPSPLCACDFVYLSTAAAALLQHSMPCGPNVGWPVGWPAAFRFVPRLSHVGS